MGCDGGSIPRRDEMVKLKKKAEKVLNFNNRSINYGILVMCCLRMSRPTETWN